MLHIGLISELIKDARRDGMTDAELEPLFRSTEGWTGCECGNARNSAE
ncbi:MAG: hypothetical protein ACI9KE_000424 [Polyangiales bacterium]|jgi:hypothetical protein